MSDEQYVELRFQNTRDLLQRPPGEGGDVLRQATTPSGVVPRPGFAGRSPSEDARREAPPAHLTPGEPQPNDVDAWPYSRSPEAYAARDVAHHAGGLYRVLREVRGSGEALPSWMVGQSYRQDLRVSEWRRALERSPREPQEVMRSLLKPTTKRQAKPRAVLAPRAHQRWSEVDVQWLRDAVGSGYVTPTEAAERLGRTENAVISKAAATLPWSMVSEWSEGYELPWRAT